MNARNVTPFTGETDDMRRESRVRLVVEMTRAEAEALAAARIARGDSALYVADCRPIATAAADALVAAGMGGS